MARHRWCKSTSVGRGLRSSSRWAKQLDAHANQNYAENLKGKLMLVHRSMDDNVPPNNTYLVDDALMKANKNFDMLIVPNVPHGYQAMGVHHASALGLLREEPGRWYSSTDFTPTAYRDTIRAAFGPMSRTSSLRLLWIAAFSSMEGEGIASAMPFCFVRGT